MKAKFNIGLLITFFLIALVFGLMHRYYELERRQSRIEEIKFLLLAVLESRRQPLADCLIEDDLSSVPEIIEDMKIRNIIAVQLFDAKGTPLVSSPNDLPYSLIAEHQIHHGLFQYQQNNKRLTLTYSTPIRPNLIWEHVGYLTIQYDLTGISTELVNSTLIFYGSLISLFILVMMLVNMLLIYAEEQEIGGRMEKKHKILSSQIMSDKQDTIAEQLTLPASSAFKGVRVLLAEDSRIDQIVAHELCKDTGIILDIVENGHEVLAALNKAEYQMILLNISLPIMNGYETSRKIRQSGRLLPIIGVMNQGDSTKEQNRCLSSGMNDFLVKPLNNHILNSVLNKWIKAQNNHIYSAEEKVIPQAESGHSANNHQQNSADDLIPLMQEFCNHLCANNPKAVSFFKTIKSLPALTELTEQVQRLELMLDEFNFRQALEIFTEIIQKLNIAQEINCIETRRY